MNINRRNFLKLGASACVVPMLPYEKIHRAGKRIPFYGPRNKPHLRVAMDICPGVGKVLSIQTVNCPVAKRRAKKELRYALGKYRSEVYYSQYRDKYRDGYYYPHFGYSRRKDLQITQETFDV